MQTGAARQSRLYISLVVHTYSEGDHEGPFEGFSPKTKKNEEKELAETNLLQPDEQK